MGLEGESMPRWSSGQDGTKLAAAWLIERSGFPKGFGSGHIGLSSRHTLALVNRGGGTSAELVRFAREIVDGVYQRFGILLEPEPRFLGFDRDPLKSD